MSRSACSRAGRFELQNPSLIDDANPIKEHHDLDLGAAANQWYLQIRIMLTSQIFHFPMPRQSRVCKA
jgi:hypothetical protein